MLKLFLLLVVFHYASSQTFKWPSGGVRFTNLESPIIKTTRSQCFSNGYICSNNCKLLQACITLPDGFQTVDVQTCPGDLLCSAKDAACVSRENSTCSTAKPGPLQCMNFGTYPDPYDCTIYHICYGKNSSLPVDCDEGYVYNALSGSCDLDYPNEICNEPVPKCNNFGDMGPLPQNPSIFYLCLISEDGKIYPVLDRCTHGYFHEGGCIDGHLDPVCPTTAPSTTTPTSTSTSPFICTGSGLYKDPADCTKFYYCTAVGAEGVSYSCDPSYYFDDVTGGCLMGDCPSS
ncbi:uncharacterized protein [Anabrus simplex]|uniref:uncharacterized protein n=1 Tax=Anabrus simplex TaxID=316456 RepID=UPI0034DCD7A3